MIDVNRTIPLSKPDITNIEIDHVVEVLKTPYLSLGPKLVEFEEKFAKYIGTKHAIAVSSGTAGLHLSIKSLEIGENDAVFTSAFSFVASANCILFEKATPIFVDIDKDTYNIDSSKIKAYIDKHCNFRGGILTDETSGKRIKAILPVHVFGYPCEMDELLVLASEYNLSIVEDACEAIGAEYNEKKVGTFGTFGVFAFYPNKQMTTGEGGMIVTDDDRLASLCRSFRNQGRNNHGGWLTHDQLGYNYRMSDINCALGIAQLSRIEEILTKRNNVAKLYDEKLNGLIESLPIKSHIRKSWFVYVLCLPQNYTKNDRDKILYELSHENIGCNNYFPPIHLQPYYKNEFGYKEGDLPITENIAMRTIALPFHNNLATHEIERVVHCFKKLLTKFT